MNDHPDNNSPTKPSSKEVEEPLSDKDLRRMEQWAGARIDTSQSRDSLMRCMEKTDAYLVRALREIRRSRVSTDSAGAMVGNEPHCWHCGIVLEATELRPRCDECSADCDDEFCNAFGCAPATAASPAVPRDEAAGWLPIETAPKDGRTILACDGGYVVTVAWRYDDCWGGVWGSENYIQDGSIDDTALIARNLTHWMPLPAPPAP